MHLSRMLGVSIAQTDAPPFVRQLRHLRVICLQRQAPCGSIFCCLPRRGDMLQILAQRPANGTRGWILMLWDDLLVEAYDIFISTHCLSTVIHVRNSTCALRSRWWMGQQLPLARLLSLSSSSIISPRVGWCGLPWVASTKSIIWGTRTKEHQ